MSKHSFHASLLMLSILLLFTAAPVWAADPSLAITTPNVNTTIASDRSFYVFGSIDAPDALPADASLTITLTNADGQVVRTVSAASMGNTDMNTAYFDTHPGYYYDDTDPGRLKLAASGMPDLVGTGAAFTDGSKKCWFNSTDFYALVVGSTHGTIDDQVNFTDANGADYVALPEGAYTIHAVLAQGGTELASTTKSITIGTSANKVLGRFSPSNHSDKLNAFAKDHGYAIYSDAFPGYWDNAKTGVFAEILPLWRAADITEYLAGKVHCVLYNFKKSSTSYSVELGSLENQQVIDDTSRLDFYTYDIGEPSLSLTDGTTLDGTIVPVDDNDTLVFSRCDTEAKPELSEDNAINTANFNIVSTDTNVSDGITADPGQTIALNGVAVPIQNSPADLTVNGDNTVTIGNKISRLNYHITGDGIDEAIDKPITTLVRTDAEGWTNPSEVEFKHDFAITEDMAGKTLKVQVTGYDAHDTEVLGASETFDLKVTGGTPTPTTKPTVTTEPTANPTVTTHPTSNPTTTTKPATNNKTAVKTGIDDNMVPAVLAAMLCISLAGVAVYSRKH